MPTACVRFAIIGCALAVFAPAAHADEDPEVKAIRQAGGKVRFIGSAATVVDIDLSGCQKVDEVLKNLVGLKNNLAYLKLQNSSVTDAGLKAIADCEMLRVINVSDTAVTDAGLAELKKLPILSQLDLANTKVTSDGLKHLKEFPRIGTLSLGGPALNDTGLKHVGECKTVIYLTLSDGKAVTDNGLSAIAKKKNLFALRLHNTPVSTAALKQLKECSRLGVLHVTQMKLSLEAVEAIHALKQVTELDLSDTGYVPARAEDLQHVRFLRLRNAQLTVESAKALGGLTKLTSLVLTGTNCSDEMLTEIAKLKSLTTLDLSETKVTDEGIQVLKDSKQLTYLHLRKTAVTAAGTKKLKASLQTTYIIRD